MAKPNEKQAFATRLKQALKRSPKKVEMPTELALQFNLRHPSDSISQQAAPKWLTGKALPTANKMDTLADWLNVSRHWLRYDIAEKRTQVTTGRKPPSRKTAAVVEPTTDEIKVLARLRVLPKHRRYLVHEIVEQFTLNRKCGRSEVSLPHCNPDILAESF